MMNLNIIFKNCYFKLARTVGFLAVILTRYGNSQRTEPAEERERVANGVSRLRRQIAELLIHRCPNGHAFDYDGDDACDDADADDAATDDADASDRYDVAAYAAADGAWHDDDATASLERDSGYRCCRFTSLRPSCGFSICIQVKVFECEQPIVI